MYLIYFKKQSIYMHLLTTSVNAKYYLLLCIGRVILYVLLLVGLYISFIYVYIVKMFKKKNSNINHHFEFMTDRHSFHPRRNAGNTG